MITFERIKKFLFFLLNFPSTLYFNFRFLPLKQAINLPVYVCHPKIIGKGKYIIEGDIQRGMIRLGYPYVSIYKGRGLVLENNGTLIFKGKAIIGANSGISIGEKGTLILGDEFSCLHSLKIVCYNMISMGRRCRLGWDTLVCDTDFHSLVSEDGSKHTKGYGSIIFGEEIWVGSFCKFYKNTEIPSRCTIAANTLVNKKIECESYSLIYSGSGIKIKTTGFYRDIEDDKINYSID